MGDVQVLPPGGLTLPAGPPGHSGSRIEEVGVRLGPLPGALLWSKGLLLAAPPSPAAVCLLTAPRLSALSVMRWVRRAPLPRGRPPPQTVGPEEPEYLQQPHDHNCPKGSDLRCITTMHHDDHKLHDNQHCNSRMTIQPP